MLLDRTSPTFVDCLLEVCDLRLAKELADDRDATAETFAFDFFARAVAGFSLCSVRIERVQIR